jgi:hypothetical protein
MRVIRTDSQYIIRRDNGDLFPPVHQNLPATYRISIKGATRGTNKRLKAHFVLIRRLCSMRKGLNDINSYLRIKKKTLQNTKQWSVSQHFLFELTSISHDYDMYLKQSMVK